ncbi:MAG: hypothetical protein D6714_11650 [Bacteroidetes bacterium]|nr:MAG: hypothetical protein D6714_11650 [Bacteroidota bacterium]
MGNHPDFARPFYAKLLLFGEHTILKGSEALAIPFSKFGGQWALLPADTPPEIMASRQQDLPRFLAYLESPAFRTQCPFEVHLDAFRAALAQGLYFDSNIPTGYGLGSSGALVAAFADAFCEGLPSDFIALKEALSRLEHFFHGASSGIDPFICYLNRPVLTGPGNKIVVTQMPAENATGKHVFFLLDTKIKRKTGPFVQVFLKKCASNTFWELCSNTLIPAVNASIHAFLHSDWSALWENFHKIGASQYRFWPEFIPESFRDIWQKSLDSASFRFKLCGAGGGGFILGLSTNWPETRKALEGYEVFPFFRF